VREFQTLQVLSRAPLPTFQGSPLRDLFDIIRHKGSTIRKMLGGGEEGGGGGIRARQKNQKKYSCTGEKKIVNHVGTEKKIRARRKLPTPPPSLF